MVMLRSNKSKQSEIECVSIEDLVPDEHLLRRIDQYIFAVETNGWRTCVSTDTTHLKANANKRTFIKQEVEASTKSYIDELDQAIEEEDRRKHICKISL